MKLIFLIPDKPGALCALLLAFAVKSSQVQQIYSHAVKDKLGTHAFCITVNGFGAQLNDIADIEMLVAASLSHREVKEFPKVIEIDNESHITSETV